MSVQTQLVMQVADVAARAVVQCITACRTPDRCIVIDPGYPSEVNSGTKSINGVVERDVNGAVVRKLERHLTGWGSKSS